MTAQQAIKMWSRHDASVESSDGKKYTASARETYQVLCDVGDGPSEILSAPGLPSLHDRFPGTSQVRVISKIPTQISPIFWHVDVGYKGEFGPGGSGDSPLNQPPTIRWGKVESDEPVDEDLAGKAIVTANNEPIEGVTKKINDLTVTITRNYAGIDMAATHEYLHSVNSDRFLNFSAGVAKLVDFSAEEKVSERVGGYWEVTATIQFRYPYRTTPQKAWYARVLHQGFKVKIPIVGPVQPGKPDYRIINAVDANMQDLTRPVLLKSTGYEETNPNAAHWLELQIYKPLPYNDLGLL